MSLPASIPKALYQANIDLALRIAALLQENGKQWFDLFAEEASTRLEEGLSQASSFQSGLSLEKLSSLPVDVATQFLQIDMGRWQALLSNAVENQTHFADGVQQALGQWQDACSEAFDTVTFGQLPELPTGLAVLPGLSDMTASIRRFMAQAIPAVDVLVTASKPAPAPKAASEPVVKKSPVTKAAETKAVVKKAAAKAPVVTEPVAKQAAAKKPAAKAPAKSVPRKAASTPNTPLAPTLAPKPLPEVVASSRRAKKSAS